MKGEKIERLQTEDINTLNWNERKGTELQNMNEWDEKRSEKCLIWKMLERETKFYERKKREKEKRIGKSERKVENGRYR